MRDTRLPLRAAEDALLLLRTGRADMAKVVLETLPELLTRAESRTAVRPRTSTAGSRRLA
jgi:hypothetical protein